MCAAAQADLEDLRFLANELARYGVDVEEVLRSRVRNLAPVPQISGPPPAPVVAILPGDRVKANVKKIRNAVFGVCATVAVSIVY